MAWWAAREVTTSTKDAARTLGARLQASLASDGEHNLFNSYFKLYRERLGDRLPALVPQVYLHYDPPSSRRCGTGTASNANGWTFCCSCRTRTVS